MSVLCVPGDDCNDNIKYMNAIVRNSAGQKSLLCVMVFGFLG